MVLVLNGELKQDCSTSSETFFLHNPLYKENAKLFTSLTPKSIDSAESLYVGQREMAITLPGDKSVTYMGADDATTCIISVIRHSVGSGAVAIAHFDGTGVNEAIKYMVRKVQEISLGYRVGRFELHLIGGYCDPKGYGQELFCSIIQSFQRLHLEIYLIRACIGELNTTRRSGINYPILYGVGVNVNTGEIFPARFTERGPDRPLRDARIFIGAQNVVDIYDSSLGMVRIGPFNYDPLREVHLWLSQSDSSLLQHLSSSPEVEPPHFAAHMREAIKFIEENPFPAITVFHNNQPRFYRRDEATGSWVLTEH